MARGLTRPQPDGRAASPTAEGCCLVRVPVLALGDHSPLNAPAPRQGRSNGTVNAGARGARRQAPTPGR
eukprot:4178915-Alexandrium_andersonii.AAC.1